MRGSGTGGFASRTMRSGVHVEQQGTEHNNNRQFYFPNKQQQHGGHRRHHQWSEGWNGQLPSHGGGQTRRQPYQKQLLQPHHSFHHASPKCGIGGPFDCGSNATGWYQEEPPPPPSSPMGSVYQCKRCGRLGHMAQICTTPQRFEGTCNSCGQYGYRFHNCITNKYHTHAHAKVISYPSGFSRRGSKNMPCPRQQQQQQPIVNGTMPWPQQQPHQQQKRQQPQQQLISYDGDGGWVRGGINGGAGVLPPSGNGGDVGGQQRYTRGHGSVDGSGGGNISGGNGDDGYTLVAGGSGPPPNWAVEKRQDGDYTEDDSGPFVGPFGTSQVFSAEDSIIFPTLGPGLHVLARPKQQQQPPPPPHSMGAGIRAGAVEDQRARPQQQQRPPPHSMGAGVGAGAVEYQRARPQQQQRPPPHSMGAGVGAGEVEYQRARPQQQQRPPPHSMGAGVGAGAVEHQRAQSQQQQRPPPHSMRAGVGAVAEKTQHQRQSPQQELESSVVTDGAGAATSATDRWIPAAERSTGDETISGGGSGAGTVAASSTRGQQDHLVVRSPSPGPLQQQRYRVTPAVTRSRSRSRKQPPGVSRTFTLLAAEEDIARTLTQPDAAFCDSEELAAGPAHLLETPEMYAQAQAGPYGRIWAKAERKEMEGISAVGTFVEEGGV